VVPIVLPAAGPVSGTRREGQEDAARSAGGPGHAVHERAGGIRWRHAGLVIAYEDEDNSEIVVTRLDRGERLMKVPVVVCAILALAVPAFAAGPAGAEAAIEKVWQQFSDAWASGDAPARAALFAEDASLINPFGVKANGRAAIEKVFEMENVGFAKGTTHTFSDFSFRFLTPTIAEVDATGEIAKKPGAGGTAEPVLTIHVFSIMEKTHGTWQMKDARPYVFAPPPEGTE
jgi:uncharacterized protein (TIGR02246 family)